MYTVPTLPPKPPGVYRDDVVPPPDFTLPTGVPAFLGFAGQGPVGDPQRLTLASQFDDLFGAPLASGYLGAAVRGYFQNQGHMCYAVRMPDAGAPAHPDADRPGVAGGRRPGVCSRCHAAARDRRLPRPNGRARDAAGGPG